MNFTNSVLRRLLALIHPLSTLLPAAEFKVGESAFSLDDKAFQIRSGEIHYSRVPRAEWRSRIQMAKAMGLNTISTYVFWNYHETQMGEFDFKGEKDVMEFVRLCGAEDMKVIVRPGPYVCAEWDLGGLPAWLLKEPGIKVRSSDGRFLEPARNWMRRMGSMLKPLAVSRGGPVIMVQVENEFGSFGVPDSGHLPTTCCYDCMAPLDESGRPGVKFHALRSVIQQSLSNETLPAVPKLPRPGSVGDFTFTEHYGLLDSLPEGKVSSALQTMEDFGQGTGMILYRTRLEGPLEGELQLGEVKDRVHVILDGEVVGISGRSTDTPSIPLKVPAGSHKLDLLVENMGRINYGRFLNEERKGLSSPVSLAGRELGPFEHVCLPMQEPPLAKSVEAADDPLKGSLTIRRCKLKIGSPRDTWLDMRGFERGIVWFNGRNLGRYWSEGPPRSIFLPACWMKADEENELVILELEARNSPDNVPTSDKAIWGNSR